VRVIQFLISLLTFRLESGGDVGLLEILPFEEENLAGDLGERIGEAIAEIQPGGVAALAEVKESLPRQVRLLDGDRFDDDASSAEKRAIIYLTKVTSFQSHVPELMSVARSFWHLYALGTLGRISLRMPDHEEALDREHVQTKEHIPPHRGFQ